MAKKETGADTPVMRQFKAAKAEVPDALLFFRMGDFYELFFEDAVVAAKALELTLTSRNKGAADEIPMAGVPYHAATSYVQRLLDQGFRVAICEQMADPATVKGIVPREVVRVVSPGIPFDDASLDPRENVFLAAVEGTGPYGVAAVDMSTGEVFACEVGDLDGALAELVRWDPREVLLGAAAASLEETFRAVRPRAVIRVESAPIAEPEEALALLEGEPCPSLAARLAAARVLAFVRYSEPKRAPKLARFTYQEPRGTLILDEAAQRHLELVRTFDGERKGALLAHIDETKTAVGARLLRRRLLSPLVDVAAVRRRLDEVELFVVNPGLRAELRTRLGRVADLERLCMRLRQGRAMPRDLSLLRSSLSELPPIAAALASVKDAVAQAFVLPTVDAARELLGRALADDPPLKISDGGVLRVGYDAQLDESRTLTTDGQRLLTELESRLKEESGVPTLKVRYTRVFGWYLEVTRSHAARVPQSWRRKQTVANAERFTCEELDVLAEKLGRSEDAASVREAELYAALVEQLAAYVPDILAASAALAHCDVAAGLAELAHRFDFARPLVDDSSVLDIEDGRHPVVERMTELGRFVPNDCLLDATEGAESEGRARLWLVTGPNMAGKSTFMRQVALVVILAQMGSFVPCRRARIGVVDRILTRVGASDNLAKGESTFMVEMKETAHVLKKGTPRSLVVLDEIGRGTSTYDGLAIAWAVTEYLDDVVRCRALFATHYHELTSLAKERPSVENRSVSAREHKGDLVFLHRVERGAASRSYGVACGKLAGLPELVLTRARVLLETLEQGRPPPGARGRAPAPEPQLSLFGAGPHPLVGALKTLEIDRLTPLEALSLLAQWKKEHAS